MSTIISASIRTIISAASLSSSTITMSLRLVSQVLLLLVHLMKLVLTFVINSFKAFDLYLEPLNLVLKSLKLSSKVPYNFTSTILSSMLPAFIMVMLLNMALILWTQM